MWGVFFSLMLLFQCQGGKVTAQAKSLPWKTLTGNAPVVIAKNGFSGLFPDSSSAAYISALTVSSPDTILWCDVQLTKDGVGICLPSLDLGNCTDISYNYPQRNNGYLSLDFTWSELAKVFLMREDYARSEKFDEVYAILTVEDVEKLTPMAPVVWLNIQHDIFYSQHNLSMRSFVFSVSKKITLSYLSSPEVGFLRGISPRFKTSKTKLVFSFLEQDATEPSTNQTYGSLLKNLTFIRTFALGILVPKHYIWPVTSDNYLQPYTSIVMDAYEAGLEIFAGEFANDAVASYNYSYDPLAEQLSFIDNGVFSVDGVVTDFPRTSSESIGDIHSRLGHLDGCFSHINRSIPDHGKPIIISHCGASGDYPDCTNLAYQKAVEVGADIIDCPVQVTSDGVLVCMSSINLIDDTTVTNSVFSSHTSHIPDVGGTGIFTFNLTWDDIKQKLKPQISNPAIGGYGLVRNPRYRNAGNFITLLDFLKFAKDRDISGVLISIEHAAFMEDKLGFDVTNSIINTLSDTGYNNQTILGITIQSTDSSVLVKFKQQTKYNLMYIINESIRDADASSIMDMKEFADSVAVNKQSINPTRDGFITGQTKLVSTLQKGGFKVYVYGIKNEFVFIPWDYFSDPIEQINSFVREVGVDGIITDFPGTARAYKSNSCTRLGNTPNYMIPFSPGELLNVIRREDQPPAEAPYPILNSSDVVEPPLPYTVKQITPISPPGRGINGLSPATQSSEAPKCSVPSIFTILLALFGFLLSV